MAHVINGKLISYLTILKRLADKDFHIKTCLKMRTMYNQLLERFRIVEEQQKVFLDKYCERDKQGKPLEKRLENGRVDTAIKLDCIAVFEEKMNELMNADFEIAITLSAADFGDVPVSPNDIIGLDGLVDELPPVGV
jgi:predicted transcriptional regulator